ncbi:MULTISPECIES: hypothetical protein [Gammaproteobacteria]|jgi:hypothetical protein|uniref:Uncharacterized protein n=8 Tax=Pseudomonadota TaxID=1224 RepID=A0A753R224_SALER|nr:MULTISPECIES: hypothetical protein [Gammaproteobacteria]EAT2227869.1 hypothetical protein [Salmonella enterica]EBV3856699.1 hypothetical protein [Salmonella enterica subsp. enterica serovar Cerro]EDM6631245.1 hypothetical protein [Salmonella enterica subsp. enterica serovar Muenchen]EHB7073131.1 hypothetical protein [Salmonella enterica subsp. enterica serovar Heidelberg]EKU9176996.1 hypothetical protein [Enterobacter roggenkampii MGH 34]MCL5521451.1 hypothetical protein [Citrobacter crona
MEINSRAVLLACLSALRLPAGERTSDHVMQLAHLRTVLRNEGYSSPAIHDDAALLKEAEGLAKARREWLADSADMRQRHAELQHLVALNLLPEDEARQEQGDNYREHQLRDPVKQEGKPEYD